jgi:hypothetical protein
VKHQRIGQFRDSHGPVTMRLRYTGDLQQPPRRSLARRILKRAAQVRGGILIAKGEKV